MWRGGSRKSGYPRKRADLALGVRLSFLSFVSLQVSVVKLQRFYNKIRFLSFWNRFRNEFGYPLVTESRLFPLIRFFFLHNALDNLACQLTLLHKLLHFDSLCKRRGSIVVAHSFKQGVLLFFVQIRDFNGRTKSNLPFIYHLQDFGNKLGQTDKTADLVLTFSDKFS